MSYITEEWKPVVGFETIYEVSSFGRVKRTAFCNRSPNERVLKPWWRGPRGGYLCVQLCRVTRPVHQLVAEAFLGLPDDGQIVNHKDGDKSNNSVTNLEYVSYSHNARHARDMGLTRTKVSREVIPQIMERRNEGATQRQIAREFDLSHSSVCRILNGQSWN